MRRLPLPVVAATLFACSSPATVHVPSPPVGDAEAMFVAVSASVMYRVFAFDAADEPIEIELRDVGPGEPVEIEVVPAVASLDELQIASGELERVTGDDAVLLPFDGDATAFVANLGDRANVEWVQGPVSQRLRGFTIADPAPCPPLRFVGREEIEAYDFSAIVGHPGARVLLRERGRPREAIRINSSFDVVEQKTLFTPVRFTHGAISLGTEPWIATSTMAWEIDFVGGIVLTTTVALPAESSSRSIVVGDGVVFSHGRDFDVWRIPFDGPPEQLAELEDTRGGGLYVAPMAIDPAGGRVVTGNSNSSETLLYDERGVTMLPRFIEDGVRALIWVPGMSTFVAGTIDGTLYRLVDDAWELMPRPIQDDSQVRTMAPLGDGFVYVQGDTLGQHDGRRFCAEFASGVGVAFLSSFRGRLNMVTDGDRDERRHAVIEVRNIDVED